jgi:hypothetical protein
LAWTIDRVQHLAGNCCKKTHLAALCFRSSIGIDRAEYRVECSIGAGRDGQLKPFADEQVGSGGCLGKQDRVLLAHRDDSRSERDMACMLADRSKEWDRRGQVVIEVALIGPARLVAQSLGCLE